MTFLEISLVVIAIASASVAIAAVLVVRRLVPLIEHTDRLVRDARRTLRRLDGAAEDIREMTASARALETKVTRVAEPVLDVVGTSWRSLRALSAGLRAGAAVLTAGRCLAGNGRERRRGATDLIDEPAHDTTTTHTNAGERS